MSTVGSELLNEIERVSAKRERWKSYAASMGQMGNFLPGVAMMTAAIDEAKRAVISDDPAAAIRALADLRGFSNDD